MISQVRLYLPNANPGVFFVSSDGERRLTYTSSESAGLPEYLKK